MKKYVACFYTTVYETSHTSRFANTRGIDEYKIIEASDDKDALEKAERSGKGRVYHLFKVSREVGLT